MKIAFLSILLLALSCGGPKSTKPSKIKSKETIAYKNIILELNNSDSITDAKALITNSGLQWDTIAFKNDANAIAIVKVPEDKTDFWIDRLSKSNEFKTAFVNSKETLNTLIKKAKTAFFSIKKTECFGDCPVYTVTVSEKGNVTYNGKKYVNVTGTKKFTLTEEELSIFKEKLAETNFDSYKKAYDDPQLQDLPSTYIAYKGKKVQIRLWRGIPKELVTAQSYIVELLYDKKILE